MKKSWEKDCGNCVKNVQLTDDRVVIEAKYGAPDTETVGVCSFFEFQRGKFNEMIRETFGEDVLTEVRKSVDEMGKS